VDVEGNPENRKAIISVAGNGDYEFSLEEFGDYRSFREFNGLGPAEQKIYVRDRNGCGTSIAVVPKVLSAADFPAFFTPNNDSSNDNWAFNPRDRKIAALVERIRIYDRYGRLLTMLMPDSKGWDGTYNGQLLPPSDYWFIAETISGDTIKGHFTLKQ
jgi:gliding motility-associated-like protein